MKQLNSRILALLTLSVGFAVAPADAAHSVDFSRNTATIKRELHSAHYTATFVNRSERNDDHYVRDLNMKLSRTHDWALANAGQRIVDVHWIFPIFDADENDPANYDFRATDEIIRMTMENTGVDIFFRLGNAIDKSDKNYNAAKPADFEKWARICEHIVRHYNEGWANGFHYNIKYWEIWNEPDLASTKCWLGTSSEFQTFFATVIHHLKTTFPKDQYPEWHFGGPAYSAIAISGMIWGIASSCYSKKGVVPDFISFHTYGGDVGKVVDSATEFREFFRAKGAPFDQIEPVIDEWHYVSWTDPDTSKRSNENSAAFTAACHCGFQNTVDTNKYLLACTYGYNLTGSWGILDSSYNPHHNYYAMKMVGEIMTNCTTVCYSSASSPVYLLAAKSPDGRTGKLLVSCYSSSWAAGNVEISLAGLGDSPSVRSAYMIDSTHVTPFSKSHTITDGTLKFSRIKGSSVTLFTFDIPAAE